MIKLLLTFLSLLLVGQKAHCQETGEPEDSRKIISLKSVLEEGLRENVAENIRHHQRETFEMQWDTTFENFWLPQVNLNLTTDPQSLGTFVERDARGITDPGAPETADGSLGLELGDYTIYNWGRDYLEYINNRRTFLRNKERLNESRRRLRFSLIEAYFSLVRYREIQEARKEFVRNSSFIYRLTKQKLSLKKASRQMFLLSKTNFINAQNDYQQALNDSALAEEVLANLLNDPPGTQYRTTEELRYITVKADEEDALRYIAQSPDYLDAYLAMENGQRSYEKILKDNMPLPKITLNMGAYRFNYGESGSYTEFETNSGHSNIELAASINMTWNIIGGDGLMNSRAKRISFLEKRVGEISFQNIARELQLRVKTLYRTLRFQETQIPLTEALFSNSQLAFDAALDNYMAAKTGFIQLRQAVINLIDAEINYHNIKFQHLQSKLELADLMGMEDFPGENFERLAIQ